MSFMLYRDPFFGKHIGEVGIACIWSQVLDNVLVKSGWYISRGEQESKIEKAHRHEYRQPSTTVDMRHPPKYDGILRGYHNADASGEAELGYTEVARDAQAEGATKRWSDEFKMIQAMRISMSKEWKSDMSEDEWRRQYRVSVSSSRKQCFLHSIVLVMLTV